MTDMTPIDVLLISVPVISEQERFYIPDFEIPLNVCYLAAALERQEIHVAVLDMNVADPGFSLEQHVRALQPRLAGFATYTPFINVAHSYAEKLKSALPGIMTVVGGYHASALPESTLEEFPHFDYLVAGEGEETLIELARAVIQSEENKTDEDEIKQIKGLYFRANGTISKTPPRPLITDVDTLPFPARHLLQQEKYKVNPINYVELPTTGILASRGCDHRCAFCSQSVFHGRARVRGAENIAAEIEQCRADFGMRGFRFYDDNLTAYRDSCLAFCELLLKRNIRVYWNCFSRVDSVDAELLALMKRAGCHQLKLGVETGTEAMLDVIGKGITLEQSRRAVALTKRAGIECQVSIILGLPAETLDDMRATINFVREMSPDLVGYNLFKPMPGSPLFRKLDRAGLLLHKDWPEYSIKRTRPVVRDQYPVEVLEKMLSRAYLSFFFRPRYILQRMKWFLRYPRRESVRLFTGLRYILLSLRRRRARI